ncbi:hypothetical protein OEZ86_005102 [Tetradesmus obliquus]|nr:hypothetical protein OEZ86_005102 [Tetradesmus obliquus]
MQYNGPGSDWWNRDAYLDDIEALSNALAPPAHFASNVSVQALDVATGTSNFVYSRCNFSVSNLQAADAVRAQTIDVGTSLTWGGHSISEQCPMDPSDWDDLLPFRADMQGMIDVSWLKKPLSAKDVLADLWGLAEQGIDLAELGYDLWNIFKKDQPWPEAMLQALQRVMDQVQEGGSNAGVTLKWDRVKSRPVASGINLSGNRAFVGFNDDLLTSASCKLQVLPANRWTYDAQGTLSLKQVPGSAPATLIDFGSRDAWFNTVNAEALRLGSNCTILSGNPGFQLHNWVFSCNALMTASFNEDTRITFNSNSSVTISPNLTVDSNISAGAKVISPAFASPSNGSLAYNDLSAALTYNSSNFNSSRLEMFDDALEFSTQNIGQPAVQLQMSVDSNGSLYTRSNLTMPGTATIRATRTATLDAPYAEGLLRVTPDSLRFATSCNEQLGVTNEQLWMSMNSNGLFLLKNCAVFGRSEDIVYNDPVNPLLTLTRSAFPRLSATVSGGFRFGEGISNSSGQNQPHDYASISRQGGKPAFNTNNDGSFVSLALSGAALATSIGAAAMTVGGQNIMQYGADGMQLISNLAKNVAADLVNGVFKGFTRLVDADGTTLMEFTRNAQNQPLLNTSAIRSDRLQIGNASVHIDGASNALAISAPTSGTSNFFMGLAGGSNPSYWTKQWDMLTSTFQNYSPCNILVGNLTRAVKAVHVYGNGEQSMRFDVQGSVAQQLDVGSTGAAGVERTHFIKGMGTYPLVFGAGGGVERMRLTNTGNLGIGTSNPAFAIDCPNTARIGSMLIGDQGWGGGEWYGISHASCAGQNSYALLQRSDGYAVINSSNYLDLNVNNTPCVNITPTQVCALNKDLIVNNRGTEWILAPGLNQNTPDQTVCQYDVNQLSAASSTWHFFWDSMSVAGSFAASTKHFCIPHPLQPKDTCLVHACVESPRHELLYSGTARLVNGRAEVAIDSESCPDSKMRKGTFAALTEDARVLLQNNEGFTRVKGRVADGVLTIVAESQTCTDYIDWVVIAVRRASTLDDGPVIKNGRLKTEVPRGDVLLEESERPSRKRGKDQQPGGPPGNGK